MDFEEEKSLENYRLNKDSNFLISLSALTINIWTINK
jgi:hypothetical protein